MVDWSAPAPTHSERDDWLHDQAQLPAAQTTRVEWLRDLLPLALGLAFSAGLVALAFQVRASWESHRDWVVPVTVPLLVLGGVAMGYLVSRRAFAALGPALLFLVLMGGFIAFNVWRGSETEGSDAGRDALSILGGVSLGLTVASLVSGMIWVEATRPARAPAAEL